MPHWYDHPISFTDIETLPAILLLNYKINTDTRSSLSVVTKYFIWASCISYNFSRQYKSTALIDCCHNCSTCTTTMLAMSTAIISILVVGIVIHAVDGCPVVVSINGSCCEVKDNDFKFSLNTMSGIYNINNFCGNCKSVVQGYCDAYADRGGWLVVQRRIDGSVSFNRGWVEYEEGFGDLNGEFWYGITPLHCLTSQGQWELRIDLTHTNGTKTYLHYKQFAIGSASDNYPLQISQYKGIYPVDPFSTHSLSGMKFTTKDRDNDRYSGGNCAVSGNGKNSNGWWFNGCAFIKLNQQYSENDKIYDGRSWHNYLFIGMKIRPINCS